MGQSPLILLCNIRDRGLTKFVQMVILTASVKPYERGSDKRVLRSFSQFLCNQNLKKSLNLQDFACSYNRVKLLLTCNTIKGANSSDKIKG